MFPYIFRRDLDDIITVSDDRLVVSFLDMVENHKMVVKRTPVYLQLPQKRLNVKDKQVRIYLRRWKHGCHYHIFHYSAGTYFP